MKIMIVNDYEILHPVVENWNIELNSLGHQIKKVYPANSLYCHDVSKLFKNYRIVSYFLRIANIYNFFKLYWEVKKFEPELIWFHHINNLWSWICLLIPVKTGQTKVITMHELSCLYQYKITKEFLDSNLKFDYSRLGFYKGTAYKLRNFIIRSFLRNVKVVSIGELNDKILKANGVKITKRIKNFISSCSCNIADSSVKENNILFAGRIAFKGLDRVIESVLMFDTWKLYLAGSTDLVDYARATLPESRFVYLGDLKNTELVRQIHKMKFVSVLSECYDNFPTIGIEAFAHGSLALTSPTTGLVEICNKVSPHLILDDKQILDLDYLDSMFYSGNRNITSQDAILIDLSTFLEHYMSLLN